MADELQENPHQGPMQFLLKNLAAEEFPLEVGDGMETLEDLMYHVRERFGIPFEYQNFSCTGRSYSRLDNPRHNPAKVRLTSILRDAQHGENQDRIIWLLWARETDYYSVHQGGIVLENVLETKRAAEEANGRAFEAITISAWRALRSRILDCLPGFDTQKHKRARPGPS